MLGRTPSTPSERADVRALADPASPQSSAPARGAQGARRGARMTAPGQLAPRRRNRMDRFIDAIELLAAIFVGIVAADIFFSVLLRKLFSVSIPESYDVGRFLLGILIFWGIAATSYRGTHITVDLVWRAARPRCGRWPIIPSASSRCSC